jgi:hypothetical protein
MTLRVTSLGLRVAGAHRNARGRRGQPIGSRRDRVDDAGEHLVRRICSPSRHGTSPPARAFLPVALAAATADGRRHRQRRSSVECQWIQVVTGLPGGRIAAGRRAPPSRHVLGPSHGQPGTVGGCRKCSSSRHKLLGQNSSCLGCRHHVYHLVSRPAARRVSRVTRVCGAGFTALDHVGSQLRRVA